LRKGVMSAVMEPCNMSLLYAGRDDAGSGARNFDCIGVTRRNVGLASGG
jgi:hypothetical protein